VREETIISLAAGAPLNAPPEVEDASSIGAVLTNYAAEDHTHSGVNLQDNQTIAGRKRFTGDQIAFLGAALAGQQAAVADLTDNTAGTANDTCEAIPNPADAPASADALRDDLVANTLPAIRNNFADLIVKVNALLSTARTFGFRAT